MTEREDAELLLRVAARDREAFADLMRRYQDKLFGLIYRHVQDRNLAEDLCQEAFLRVWKYAGSFKGRSSAGTWLYRLAVNVCLDHHARCKKKPQPLPLNTDGVQADTGEGDLEREARREILLYQALGALPERQRMALVLARFAGCSYEEVGALMGLRLGAVESLLFRARRNLASWLEPFRRRGDL